MPHIIIEHSEGCLKKDSTQELAQGLHGCLAKQETIKLENIKTRTRVAENVIVGDGVNNEFIHVDVLLLQGRSQELRLRIGQALFNQAKQHLGNRNLKLSVNVGELGEYVK